jgi:hypothetical protein
MNLKHYFLSLDGVAARPPSSGAPVAMEQLFEEWRSRYHVIVLAVMHKQRLNLTLTLPRGGYI